MPTDEKAFSIDVSRRRLLLAAGLSATSVLPPIRQADAEQ
jgi:hypothetical protein